MKKIEFCGTALEDLKAFPSEARHEAGYQLEKVQDGLQPHDWKDMKTVGAGVKEIRIRDATGAYRVVYIAKLAGMVYVLHCFKKTTQQTSKRDIELARERLKEIKEGSS